ncbi:hypothetical protein ASG93_12985 [Paenibacillus sp. Soil787]|nr:hypothetical protein ASG93_12985 [Paenibacillus sp. Soil787]
MKMVDTSSTTSLTRISKKVSVTQDEEYTASIFAYIEQGSIDVWLIFYNGTTETIVAPTSVTPTLNQWTKKSITAKTPTGTTQAAVMVYSSYMSIGAKLYAVHANSATKEAVVSIGAGVSLLTTDNYGDLYYVKYETNLYKYDK